MHIVNDALEKIALSELLYGSSLVFDGLPHPRIVSLFCCVVIYSDRKVVRISLIEQIPLTYDPSISLFKVARPPGGIKMMRGYQTLLHVHASTHLGGGAEQYSDMTGVHVAEQL